MAVHERGGVTHLANERRALVVGRTEVGTVVRSVLMVIAAQRCGLLVFFGTCGTAAAKEDCDEAPGAALQLPWEVARTGIGKKTST